MTRKEFLALLNKHFDKENDIFVHKQNGEKMSVVFVQKPFEIEPFEKLLSITNANLFDVLDIYDLQNEFALLFKYTDGNCITEIYQNKIASVADMKNIIVSVCNALMVLHMQGITYPKLDPEDVFVSSGGLVKVGFSKREKQILAMCKSKKVPKKTDCKQVGELMNFTLTGHTTSESLYEGKKIASIIKKAIGGKYESVEDIKVAVMKL